ncbi:MAG: hypothetical protein KAR06_11655, partial [Deltaproteobacteria bacterium]|nr:hypothetical protein [Deltaproteobacteria bacterium]
MITTGKHSSGLLQKFGVISPRVLRGTLAKNVIWIHAVSVGETMAAMPLVKRLKHEHPELMIVFSTITPTGNAVAMKEGKGIIDSLIYFPLDLSWIVRRVVRKVNPKTFILIEKEIWPNTLRIMNEEHVPVIVVNGSISKKSFKNYKRFSFLFKNIFSNMEHYMGCTDADTQMAITLGVKADKATTCGNLKFDVKAETKEVDAEALRSELMVSVTDKLFIAGSTHDGEEAIIISSYLAAKKIIPELKLIIAPRHSNRCNKVEELLKNSAIAYARRSYHETLE